MNMHVKLNERLSATLQHGSQFADYLEKSEAQKRSLWDRIVSVFYDRDWQPYVSVQDRVAVNGKLISGLMMKRSANGVVVFREMTETEQFEICLVAGKPDVIAVTAVRAAGTAPKRSYHLELIAMEKSAGRFDEMPSPRPTRTFTL